MFLKNKDNLIIKYSEWMTLFEIIVILMLASYPAAIFVMPDTIMGIVLTVFGIALNFGIIYLLIKKNRENIDYYPERVYYQKLDNGLTEYRYVYYFWEKNKKNGCIKALQDKGVNSIYTKRITLLRRMVYGNTI